MQICLDLLDRHQVKATFFVLGWIAERHPALIREIKRRGHEIGCHSYRHPVIFEMDEAAFREDCRLARAALAACGIEGAMGYRAPSFSITPPVHHYLDILLEEGFSYDCSLFPVRHPRYGQPNSPRTPFRVGDVDNSLTVVPMPTWRFLGQNFPFSGGGYLRLLPWQAFRFLRSQARRQGIPCIIYLHPWELDDFKPQVGQSTTMSIRSHGGQDTMPRKLEKILKEGKFQTLGEYVESLMDGNKLE